MEIPIGKRISNFIIIIIFSLVIIAIALIVILKVSFFRINGSSMEPTLYPRELVLALPCKNPQRGDLIAFDLEGTMTIKRIIGIPGDEVFIDDDGNVYLNGEKLEEEYTKKKYKGDVEVSNPYKVQKGEYYVLGDNRQDSKDSRLIKVGGIRKDEIESQVIFSISKFKKIE